MVKKKQLYSTATWLKMSFLFGKLLFVTLITSYSGPTCTFL